MKEPKSVAVILSSGGLDSTCLLAYVKGFNKKYDTYDEIVTLGFAYGQKHDKELQSAKLIAQEMEVKHYVLDLTSIFKGSDSTLIKGSGDLQHKSYAKQLAEDSDEIVDSYVPFRNGLMLASAASWAMSTFGTKSKIDLYMGTHSEDSDVAAYADTSKAFSDAMHSAINVGTYGNVKVLTPFVKMTKGKLLEIGLENNAPVELSWSCYEGADVHCGTCATCVDRINAFKEVNASDPTIYLGDV